MSIDRTICLLAAVIAGVGASGCTVGTYEDVSSRPEIAPLLGAKVTLRQDMVAVGTTSDQNYRGGVDVVHVVPQGISGPEVKATAKVAAGATATITGAVVLRTWLPGERLRLVVSGLACSICGHPRTLVDAVIVNSKPTIPDYLSDYVSISSLSSP